MDSSERTCTYNYFRFKLKLEIRMICTQYPRFMVTLLWDTCLVISRGLHFIFYSTVDVLLVAGNLVSMF